MMKWLQTIILLIAFTSRWNPVFCQLPCATPSPTEAQKRRYEAWVASLKMTPPTKAATSLQYVPIRFHVIRRDDGSGGTDLATLNQALVLLNQLYKQAGIAFYMCGSQPNFINSTQYFDFNIDDEDALVANNYANNAINVYLPNSITYFGSVVGGYAYFPDPDALTNRVFSLASKITNSYTLAHELGHYFNLYHTFENNNNANTSLRELVIRPGEPQNGRPFSPNCSTTGDFLCDTPADPYGRSGASTSGCAYTGTITDANGDVYHPDITNIMSYYSLCVNSFTQGQYARMAEGLLLRTASGNQYTLDCIEQGLATPSIVAVNMTAQGAQIQFTFSGNNASGFIIERSTSPTDGFVAIAGLPPGTFSYTDGALTSNTTYYYRVKASNAANQYSNVQSINSSLFYCIPIYTQPVSNFVPAIADFIIQGTSLSNLNTGNPNSNRYSNFTQTAYNVTAGQTYTFIARAVTGGFGTYINQHATVWLDVNRDGILSSNEILFQSTGSQYMNPSLTGTITIPSGMTAGPARLRIRSQYSPDGVVTDPCNTLRFGETEDYTLNIQGSVVCFTASSSVTHVTCNGGNTGQVNLIAQGATSPVSYTLNGIVNSTGLFTNLTAGQYTAIIRDANNCQSTLPLSLTQGSAISASILGTTAVCGPQTVNLSVNVSGGQSPYRLTIYNGSSSSQYTNYISGTAIPVAPSQSTVYTLLTVQDANNCSSSPNTSVAVTVNAIPNASISGNLTVCNGGSTVLTANGGASYNWSTGGSGNTLTVNTPGVYSVTAISSAGCRAVATTNVVQCSVTSFTFKAKFLLEGYLNAQTGQMSTALASNNVLPHTQPFNVSPWFYTGTEQASSFPASVSDWVLVIARANDGTIIDRKAGFVQSDGTLISTSGSEGILFTGLPGTVYFSIHHKSHLAVMTNNPVTSNVWVDFRNSASAARGSQQQKLVGSWYSLYSGDYDGSGVINNLDFNRWRQNSASVNQYLSVDSDGNGIVNNLDFNRWTQNRSKVGATEIQP